MENQSTAKAKGGSSSSELTINQTIQTGSTSAFWPIVIIGVIVIVIAVAVIYAMHISSVNKTLMTDLEKTSSVNKTLMTDLEKTSSVNKTLMTDLENAKSDLDKKQKEIRALEQKDIKKSEERIQKLEQDLILKDSEIVLIRKELTEVQQNFDGIQKKGQMDSEASAKNYDKYLEAIAKHAKLEEKIKTLEAQLKAAKDEVASLGKKIGDLDNKVVNLEKNIELLNVKVIDTQKIITAMISKLPRNWLAYGEFKSGHIFIGITNSSIVHLGPINVTFVCPSELELDSREAFSLALKDRKSKSDEIPVKENEWSITENRNLVIQKISLKPGWTLSVSYKIPTGNKKLLPSTLGFVCVVSIIHPQTLELIGKKYHKTILICEHKASLEKTNASAGN